MEENFDQIRIVLIGNSCLVTGHRITIEVQKKMEAVAKTLRSPLELALLDADFFRLLQEPNLNSLYNLNNEFSYFGLLLDEIASIEIWINRKRRRTIKVAFEDPLHTRLKSVNQGSANLLFPEHNLNIQSCDLNAFKKNIILVERSVGGVMTFGTHAKNLDLSKFEWGGHDIQLEHPPLFKMMTNILYDGANLTGTKSDNLVRSRSIMLNIEE